MIENIKTNRLDVSHLYSTKNKQYFSGARVDYLNQLNKSKEAQILEIGCGFGETGELALQLGICQGYYGIEIFEDAANIARTKITDVLIGNVETLSFPWADETFDTLIMSEVLEHLIDPWGTLQKLFPLLKKNAVVYASSPNVSNYKVIRMLLKGDWLYEEKGIMDRTHLRWFTSKTYKELFESAGFKVLSIGPLVMGRKENLLSKLLLNKFDYLLYEQHDIRAIKE